MPNRPLESRVVFGHVRKATSTINDENAHPFVFNHLLFMHNGALDNFADYKPTLLKRLRPAVRGLIQGTVDSEHAGALFCNNLEGFPQRRDFSMTELRGAMRTMVAELRALSAEAALARCAADKPTISATARGPAAASAGAPSATSGLWAPSSMNFAVSDGQGLVVTRFRSHKDEDPPSLYYKLGLSVRYRTDEGKLRAMAPGKAPSGGVISAPGLIVASEPLEESMPSLSAWRLLGKDKMISYHPSEGVKIECISDQCTPDLPADVGAIEEA
jgi:glutamine amidotransferase